MSLKKIIFILITLFFIGLFSFMHFFDFHSNEDVIVSVIDSGIDYNHPDINSNIVNGFDFIDFDFNPMDEHGHGTHIAGIISENAPKATILNVRVLNKKNEGYGSFFAILYSIFNGADIINMSFYELKNPFTQLAIKYGKSKGVIFIASTGNEHQNKVSFPALLPEVLAVGNVDKDTYHLADSSNYGYETDFLAPGVDVFSTHINGTYKKLSGTSMSAAYVTSIIAYLKSINPNLTDEQIQDILYASSSEIFLNDFFKVVNFDKIKADTEHDFYFDVLPVDKVQTSNTVNIATDSSNVNFVLVYNNGKLISAVSQNLEKISFNLKDGYHKLKIVGYGDKVIKEEIDFYVDTKEPIIVVNQFPYFGHLAFSFDFYDANLTYINVGGDLTHFDTPKNHSIQYFIDDDIKNFPITITATDINGNETSYKLLSDTVHVKK